MTRALKTLRPFEILLVDDNAGDIELAREAFENIKVVHCLHVVRDGQSALDFLNQQGKYASAIRPDLVLLDLNMPGKNGLEVLAAVKENKALQDIPVIILTSSEAETDISQSYHLHANAYIVKPVEMSQLIKVVGSLETFWLRAVMLPTQLKKTG